MKQTHKSNRKRCRQNLWRFSIVEVISIYIYPDNLKAKATLFFWELKDIGIIGIGMLISVFAIAKLGTTLPLAISALYAFLTIRLQDSSILDYIRYAAEFFLGRPQRYEWR